MLNGPAIAVYALDKAALVFSPSIGFLVGQTPPTGPLPGWLNGTIAGGVILVLLYLLKYTIGLWQAKDQALNEAKDETIRQQSRELREIRERLDAIIHEKK